jgi:hypothetical protein
MTDNRTKNSHPSDLWDYRHAKLLVDILAHADNSSDRFDLDVALIQLCKNWGIEPKYFLGLEISNNFLDTEATIQRLAQHCLEHGREEYQTRKAESDKS